MRFTLLNANHLHITTLLCRNDWSIAFKLLLLVLNRLVETKVPQDNKDYFHYSLCMVVICLILKHKGHYRFAFQYLIKAPVVVSRRPLEKDLGTKPVEEDTVSLSTLWTSIWKMPLTTNSNWKMPLTTNLWWRFPPWLVPEHQPSPQSSRFHSHTFKKNKKKNKSKAIWIEKKSCDWRVFSSLFFQIKPFCECVFSRRSEALKTVHFEEITGVGQMVDFMTPPVGLSVAATLNDQIPAQKKKAPVIVQPQAWKQPTGGSGNKHSGPTGWSSRCALRTWCLWRRGPPSLWTRGQTAAQSWSCRCPGSCTWGRSPSPPASAATSGSTAGGGRCSSGLGSGGRPTSWKWALPW